MENRIRANFTQMPAFKDIVVVLSYGDRTMRDLIASTKWILLSFYKKFEHFREFIIFFIQLENDPLIQTDLIGNGFQCSCQQIIAFMSIIKLFKHSSDQIPYYPSIQEMLIIPRTQHQR